jgi:hypothetical protein
MCVAERHGAKFVSDSDGDLVPLGQDDDCLAGTLLCEVAAFFHEQGMLTVSSGSGKVFRNESYLKGLSSVVERAITRWRREAKRGGLI